MFFLPRFYLKLGQYLPLLGTVILEYVFRCGIPLDSMQHPNIYWQCTITKYIMTFDHCKLQPHNPTAPEEGLGGGDVSNTTKALPAKHFIANIHSPLNSTACGRV